MLPYDGIIRTGSKGLSHLARFNIGKDPQQNGEGKAKVG